MFCGKCGKQVKSGVNFCPNCGAALNNGIIKNPVNPTDENNADSPAITHDDTTVSEVLKPVADSDYTASDNKPVKKTKHLKAIIAIAVVLVVSIVVSIITVPMIKSKLANEEKAVFYVKDGNIYAILTNNNKTVQLTENLFLDDMGDKDLFVSGEMMLEEYLYYDSEHNKVIFPDDLKTVDSRRIFSLYYADLDNAGKKDFEPVKIDSEIVENDNLVADYLLYSFDTEMNTIYYIKEGGELYGFDTKSEVNTKIDDDVVSSFFVSDSLVYLKSDEYDRFYTLDSNGSCVEFAKDIELCDMYSSYSDGFLYEQNDILYLFTGGSDPKQIAELGDNAVNYAIVNNGGIVYYSLSNNTDKLNAYDYINDDLAESDAVVTEPDYMDDKYWNADTFSFTDEYYNLRDAYEQKRERDELRNTLKSTSFNLPNEEFYYFDGNENKKLSDGAIDVYTVDDNFMYLEKKDIDASAKINFSTLCEKFNYNADDYELSDYMSNQFVSNKITSYAVMDGNLLEIPSDNNVFYCISVNSHKDTLYYLQKTDKDYCYDFYKADIKNGSVSNPVKISDSVCNYCITDNGDVLYYKDPSRYDDKYLLADMYFNDAKIGSNVQINCIDYGSDASNLIIELNDGTFFYYDNLLSDHSDIPQRTLKYCNGKESTVTAKNVLFFYPISKNKVYYIADVDDDTYKGDLYVIEKNKAVKIESEVSGLKTKSFWNAMGCNWSSFSDMFFDWYNI